MKCGARTKFIRGKAAYSLASTCLLDRLTGWDRKP